MRSITAKSRPLFSDTYSKHCIFVFSAGKSKDDAMKAYIEEVEKQKAEFF